MSKIHVFKTGNGGNQVSDGYYAVDPSGNVVVIPPLQDLKAGFVLADEDDIAFAASRKQSAPCEREIVEPVPAPVEPDSIVVSDDPVEEVVESFSVDAPAYDPSDRD